MGAPCQSPPNPRPELILNGTSTPPSSMLCGSRRRAVPLVFHGIPALGLPPAEHSLFPPVILSRLAPQFAPYQVLVAVCFRILHGLSPSSSSFSSRTSCSLYPPYHHHRQQGVPCCAASHWTTHPIVFCLAFALYQMPRGIRRDLNRRGSRALGSRLRQLDDKTAGLEVRSSSLPRNPENAWAPP